jgi:hypothetical protein
LKPTASAFSPRSISGLALWLDASSSDLYTTDAGPVVAVASPLDIAGCALWLDGADATSMFDATSGGSQVSAGGAIARWQDKSGNGRNFVQSTSTLRPLLTASGRNGRSVVTFDATDDYMISAATQTIPQPATWMFVYKVPSSIASGWSLVDSTTDRVHVYSAAGSTITQYTAGGFFTTEASGVTADQWRIGTYHFNGASSLGKRDGVQTATGTTGTNAITGSITLGSNNGGAAVLRSQMAEAILLTGASMADIARVEAYLAAKWSIAGVHAPATASSDPVGYWGDKSGNGRHAVQATAGSRPTISATKQNGRNALAFNGSSQSLSIASYNAENGLPGLTRYVVASMSSAGPTILSRVYNGGGDTIVSTVSGQLRFFAGASTYSAVTSTNYELLTSGTNIIGSVYDGTAGSVAAGIKPYYNGAAIPPSSTSGTLPATLPSGTPGFWIGSNIGVNSFWPGRIIEYISYSRALGNADRQRLERYLSAKYGITLAPQVANADAQDWINRVYANGGSVSSATAAAVNTFCESIASAGIRSKMLRLNLFCGTGLNACLTPLYRAASLGDTQLGSTTDTNAGGLFVSGDYAETGATGGLLGNGSSKYLNTGLEQSSIPLTNLHTSASLRNGETSFGTENTLIGHYDVSQADFVSLRQAVTTGSREFFAGSFSGASTAAAASVESHILGVRSSATSSKLYRAGLEVGSSSFNIGSPSTSSRPYFVFARNNSGTPTTYTSARLRMYSIGTAMDAANALAFSTAVAAFNTALDRA